MFQNQSKNQFRKKITAALCVMAMLSTLLAGCGNQKSSDSSTAASKNKEETFIVKVTEVEEKTVTAEKGEITQDAETQEPPEKPEGEEEKTSDSEEEKQEPPEKPEGEAEGQEPPEKPEGEAEGQEPPEKPGTKSGFTSSGESVTFKISDDTSVTLESVQGSGEGTLEDIVAGAVLEVTLDDDDNALEVLVKNLNTGGGFGGSEEVTNGTAASTIEKDSEISKETYSSSGDDENALRIDGAEVTLDEITVEKTGGDSSNTENGDFYGQNAGLLALNGAEVTIRDADITTDAVNGNGVFSYGTDTVVNISDSVIRTSQNNSGGIQTTGGGTTNAENLDIETQGNSAAAIRSDRGGGTVKVKGGTYVTNGTGSPAIYCTADVTVSSAELTANHSEAVVVEGKNSVSLKNCDLVSDMDNTYHGDSDENIHAVMIYQSMSGDADVGEAAFSAEGGSITAKAGDLFYITNTDCEINLKDVDFTLANDTFLRVEGNSSSRGWGTEGANGGDVVLKAEDQKIEGNLYVDNISSLDLSMKEGTSFQGAINPDGEGGTVNVTMDDSSEWNLTADSYISSFDGDVSQITANGFHVYVNGEAIV